MATDVATSALSSPVRSQQTSPKPQPVLETVIENRIFVGGIPTHANVNELRAFLAEIFSKAVIKDIKIISDKTGVSKGYGFVTFETRDMAQEILNSSDYDNLIFKDRKLNISKAVKKLSTKLDNSGGGGVSCGIIGGSAVSVGLGAPAAFLTDTSSAANTAGPVQYLLYRRPDSGLGQILTALPFGYCTPIYLSGSPQNLPLFSAAPGVNIGATQLIAAAAAAAAAPSSIASSSSTVCSTSSSIQWPPAATAAAALDTTCTSASAAQMIGAASALACLTSTATSGGATAAAGISQNGELIYYSLPALAAATAAVTNNSAVATSTNSHAGGGHSDFGTGSEPSNSLLTDTANDSSVSSDNGISGFGLYGIIGSPVPTAFKTAFDCCSGAGCNPQTSSLLSHRHCCSNGTATFNLTPGQPQKPPKPQPHQQPLLQQQQQQLDNCDLLFGGSNLFSELRQDFKFFDQRLRYCCD